MEEQGHFQLPGIVQIDPCDMGPCIIMLKHEVTAADERHDNGPQDLIMVSLCIQIAIDQMQLCSLSIVYPWPYHNPTMGNSVHNVDITKPYKWSVFMRPVLHTANSLKLHLRQLIVEKGIFNYLAAALVDIPAVRMPIALP